MKVKIIFSFLILLSTHIQAATKDLEQLNPRTNITNLLMRQDMVNPEHDKDLEKIGPILSCSDFVQQAQNKLHNLHQWIQEKKQEAELLKLEPKDFDLFNKKVELQIKEILKDVKQSIDWAEKEAGAAI